MTDAVSDSMPDHPASVYVYVMLLNRFGDVGNTQWVFIHVQLTPCLHSGSSRAHLTTLQDAPPMRPTITLKVAESEGGYGFDQFVSMNR